MSAIRLCLPSCGRWRGKTDGPVARWANDQDPCVRQHQRIARSLAFSELASIRIWLRAYESTPLLHFQPDPLDQDLDHRHAVDFDVAPGRRGARAQKSNRWKLPLRLRARRNGQAAAPPMSPMNSLALRCPV